MQRLAGQAHVNAGLSLSYPVMRCKSMLPVHCCARLFRRQALQTSGHGSPGIVALWKRDDAGRLRTGPPIGRNADCGIMGAHIPLALELVDSRSLRPCHLHVVCPAVSPEAFDGGSQSVQ